MSMNNRQNYQYEFNIHFFTFIKSPYKAIEVEPLSHEDFTPFLTGTFLHIKNKEETIKQFYLPELQSVSTYFTDRYDR